MLAKRAAFRGSTGFTLLDTVLAEGRGIDMMSFALDDDVVRFFSVVRGVEVILSLAEATILVVANPLCIVQHFAYKTLV